MVLQDNVIKAGSDNKQNVSTVGTQQMLVIFHTIYMYNACIQPRADRCIGIGTCGYVLMTATSDIPVCGGVGW